ncbi:hypothetical protein BDU57DRAFT_589671 [Ampelomyces quisqualis]|uniref:Rhodopsin domain-containing protein n=1 Tax=Ampelomyces quisqualis TaxID=50730 RepID=A0A6A5QBD6_AMPQU|nr:hypothetical protein BDU57DRAFT_589671 [Ampelomyces quisqualis]
MFLIVPASGCGLHNTISICNNNKLAQKLEGCILANCTREDTPGLIKSQPNICSFSQESRRTEIIMYTSIVYGIAFILVVFSLAGKLIAKQLYLDDWIFIATVVLLALPVGCVLAVNDIGFGEHLWNLKDGEFLVIFRLKIFSCMPLSALWNRNQPGKCLNIQALAKVNCASVIIQDVMLLVLQLVFIRSLQIKRYCKIAVGLMFSIGTFGCIAAIIRLRTLLGFKTSIDPIWDYVPPTIWTELELLDGFACVSLPSIRILLATILPKEFNELLLLDRQSSRDENNPSLERTQQREWKKPSSWISSTTKSSLWSPLIDYSDCNVAVIRPPFLDKRLDLGHEQRQLSKVAKPSNTATRHSSRSHSSRQSQITALPPM